MSLTLITAVGVSLSSWTAPPSMVGHSVVNRRVLAAEPRMMFGGGGGDGEEKGFMDKLKQAQQMFNPEMMKKYSEVGMKVQQLQEELAQTEVECASKDGAVVVKVSGTQVTAGMRYPLSMLRCLDLGCIRCVSLAGAPQRHCRR
jgi:hypothetical protein